MHAARTLRGMTEIEGARAARPKRSWSLDHWGMRLFYSVIAGAVVNWTTGAYALGTVVAVVLFVLTTAIVTVGRRRQDGTADQP